MNTKAFDELRLAAAAANLQADRDAIRLRGAEQAFAEWGVGVAVRLKAEPRLGYGKVNGKWRLTVGDGMPVADADRETRHAAAAQLGQLAVEMTMRLRAIS